MFDHILIRTFIDIPPGTDARIAHLIRKLKPVTHHTRSKATTRVTTRFYAGYIFRERCFVNTFLLSSWN